MRILLGFITIKRLIATDSTISLLYFVCIIGGLAYIGSIGAGCLWWFYSCWAKRIWPSCSIRGQHPEASSLCYYQWCKLSPEVVDVSHYLLRFFYILWTLNLGVFLSFLDFTIFIFGCAAPFDCLLVFQALSKQAPSGDQMWACALKMFACEYAYLFK